jgi:hypothetical protein
MHPPARDKNDVLQPVGALGSERRRRNLFVTLAAAGGPPAEVLIDSMHMKVHRSAGGGKGSVPSSDRD